MLACLVVLGSLVWTPPVRAAPVAGTVSIEDGDGFVNAKEVDGSVPASWSSGDSTAQSADVWFETESGSIPTGCGPFTGLSPSGTGSLNKICATSLPEGTFFFKAVWYDAAGNASPQASDASVKDTIAPTLEITAWTDPITAANHTNTSASGTTEPGATVTVDAAVSHNLRTSPKTATVDTSGNWTVSGIDVSAFPDCPTTFTATAADPAGNTTVAQKKAAKDTVAEVAIEEVTDPVNSVNATEATASGEAETGSEIAMVVTDGTTSSPQATTTTNDAGFWSASTDASGLSDGTVSYEVTATDPFGNSDTVTRNATKDTVAPGAGTVEILDGDGWSSKEELGKGLEVKWVSGDATADGARVWFEAPDGSIPPFCGPFTGLAPTGKRAMNPNCALGLPEGEFFFKARWTRNGNLSAPAADSSVKDTIPPATPTASFRDGPIVDKTEWESTVVEGFTEPGAIVDVVVIDEDAATKDVGTRVLADSTGAYAAELDLSVEPLSDGRLRVDLVARDAAGNKAEADEAASAILDTKPPQSTWLTPPISAYPSPLVVLAGLSEDAATEITGVTVWFEETSTGEIRAAEAALSPELVGRTRAWTVATELPAGEWLAFARATDAAGHIEFPGPAITILVVG